MDIRDMPYEDNFFDLIIDKSTMDALLCGDESFLNVAIMTKEIQRVLKISSVYMIISYGLPENRLMHLEREHLAFEISIYTIKKEINEDGQDKDKVFYYFICRFIMYIFAEKKKKLISLPKILLMSTMNLKNRKWLN